MHSEIRIRFLGVRALHASPAKANQIYGGNSSCTVIESGNEVLVINSGFGANSFGENLISSYQDSKKTIKCHIFLSDYLWDNVVGLPFFTPLHFKSSRIHVHSPLPMSRARDWLCTIWGKEFSPFDGIESFRSRIFLEDPSKVFTVGPWRIQAILTDHPLAPYPQAVWKFCHSSGQVIVVSANKYTSDLKRREVISKIKGCDILIQSAIAPSISHPTMGGRFTFSEALHFGQEAEAKQVFLNGLHPSLTDIDLTAAERDFSRSSITNGKKASTRTPSFFIARECNDISVGIPIDLKKAGAF